MYSQYIFQFSFAATATTIVSGAIAMRMKFGVYVVYSSYAVIIYAFVAHWIWAEDGWLNTLGVHDFAGGGPVHLLGGMNGLIAILFIGPRTGYFKRRRNRQDFAPASPASTLFGLFMLWWGWIGFNCGSTFGNESCHHHHQCIGRGGSNRTFLYFTENQGQASSSPSHCERYSWRLGCHKSYMCCRSHVGSTDYWVHWRNRFELGEHISQTISNRRPGGCGRCPHGRCHLGTCCGWSICRWRHAGFRCNEWLVPWRWLQIARPSDPCHRLHYCLVCCNNYALLLFPRGLFVKG